VRPERTALDLEANRFAGNLDVVMEQFEPRILSDADPYDTSPPKVREGSDPADVHHELAMPSSDRREDILDLTESVVRLLAEEFEGEVKARLADPRQLRRTLAKRRGRVENAAPDVGRKVDRDEETHSGNWLSRRSTPMAR